MEKVRKNMVGSNCKGRSYLSVALQVVRPELEYHVAAWSSGIKADKNKDCLERVQRRDNNMVGTCSAGKCVSRHHIPIKGGI